MERTLTADIILTEIEKMVRAHEGQMHKMNDFGIDTLSLIFRRPVSDLIPLLKELEIQGCIILYTPPMGSGRRAGTICMVKK